MAFNRAFMKKWVPVEVLPIIGICGMAVGGATFYLYRLSQGSEVVWDRKGDWRPWDKVKHDQNIKVGISSTVSYLSTNANVSVLEP